MAGKRGQVGDAGADTATHVAGAMTFMPTSA
jgi:hypothetical protein